VFTRRRGAKLAAFGVASALVLAACAGDDSETPAEPGDETEASTEEPAADVTVTHTFEQEISTYNSNPAEDNASKNAIVLQRVQSGFWFFGEDGVVTNDADFGTYELVSEDPVTVEYSINDAAVWSDGNPIDCDDVLLWWAVNSGNFPDFSVAGTTGTELVAVPDCAAGDKSYTAVYSEPFADWEATAGAQATGMLPAHVVEEQAGLSEDEFIAAVQGGDTAALADAAAFHNTGWIFDGALPDEALIPSSGPYKLDSWEPGQSITLTANENYWGTPPAAGTVVIRFIVQDEQAQALANGEVNIIEPQANPDILNQLEGATGIEVFTGGQYLYDHLDFNFDSSPFSDLQLREAFAKCVPRELINANLIQPLDPSAEPMAVRNVAPFEPHYATVAEGSGAENYAEVDIEGAAAILADTGNEGLEVKIGYNTPNPRRTDVVALIADSCGEAGFNVVDAGEDTFFEEGGGLAENTYDVALFGWAGSSLVSGWASTFSTADECTPSGKGNNNGCYSNPDVDALIAELNAAPDPEAQVPLIAQVEQLLWADLATIPLYTQPYLAAWSETVENVIPNPAQSSITWNMDKWAAM
jgi:ABC-type transport system substrate-binding protein